jgi:uncharacterized membrane-anchored protein YitT (DUF2179 family)
MQHIFSFLILSVFLVNNALAHGGHLSMASTTTHTAMHMLIAGALLLPFLWLSYRRNKGKQAQVESNQ